MGWNFFVFSSNLDAQCGAQTPHTLRSRVCVFYQLSQSGAPLFCIITVALPQLRLYLARAVVDTVACDTSELEDNYVGP